MNTSMEALDKAVRLLRGKISMTSDPDRDRFRTHEILITLSDGREYAEWGTDFDQIADQLVIRCVRDSIIDHAWKPKEEL